MGRILCEAILPDVEDFHGLFRRVTEKTNGRRPFLLESSLPGSALARWSFFGVEPFLTLRAEGDLLFEEFVTAKGSVLRNRFREHPLDALQKRLEAFRAEPSPHLASPFPGGGVGVIAYDMGRLIEPVTMNALRDIPVPDLDVAFYAGVVAYELATRRVYLLRTELPGVPSPDWLEVVPGLTRSRNKTSSLSPGSSQVFQSSFSREAYCKAVRRVQDYIAAGDVYQVNLSQRFVGEWNSSPWVLYAKLREHNPAPFSAYLELDGMTLLSSSPERFLRYDAATRSVETRPIKGTRPCGQTPEEEKRYLRELLGSAKEAAELVMIVDLERNDLGRVCAYGSVEVPELRVVERYASVLHTVATVKGRLAPEKNLADLLRATFPGGSITGAPKIRAMEIIDELEPVRRGFYTGSIGYFGWNGNLDLNIAIRTLFVQEGVVSFGVGGGIVADSDPEAEYEETLHKARALFEALS